MIADEGCWERGCACHDRRDSPGVELVKKRVWVGLTDEERNSLWRNNAPTPLMIAIEAKLKERNT